MPENWDERGETKKRSQRESNWALVIVPLLMGGLLVVSNADLRDPGNDPRLIAALHFRHNTIRARLGCLFLGSAQTPGRASCHGQ